MSGLACAVVGLGEAGARYAQALAALGGPVAGFDPGGVATPEGVERADTIEAARLHGKNNLSPWEGHRTRGLAVATVVRGQVVMRESVLCGAPAGRMVARGLT